MTALLLTAALAAAQNPNQQNQQPNQNQAQDRAADGSLDGNWSILCFEKNGQPQPDAKDMTVTVKGNTITCQGKDGKPATTMTVRFGDRGTVQVTETAAASTGGANADREKPSGAAKAGVYVLTKDFLAVCVHDDAAAGGADRGAGGAATAAGGAEGGKPSMKSACTIILKREASR